MVKNAPDLAAIYGRQSKDKTKSIDEQMAECEADAGAQGWTVTAESRYSDGVSASRFGKKARKDWAKLLTDIEDGRIRAVVVWEPSRGDRTLTTWSAMLDLCRKRGVLIRVTSHGHTYDLGRPRDWRSLAEDGVDSAYESDKTSLRLKRAAAAQAAAGKPHGRVRYGYERVYDAATGKLTGEKPHPHQAPIVAEIVRRVGRREPVSRIVADLNRRSIPAPASAEWERHAVRRIAGNPAYAGFRVHGGETHAAIWPAIVTEDEHLSAVHVLTDPARKTTKPGAQKWLLSYLARCAECESHLHRVPTRRGQPPDRYACPRGCTGAPAPALDEFVSTVVCRRLAKRDGIDLKPVDARALTEARADVLRLQQRLDEWRDSAARGETSPASLARIEAGLLADLDDAGRRAAAAAMPSSLSEMLHGLDYLDDEDARYREIRLRFDSVPVTSQRSVITTLIEVLQVERADHRGRNGFDSSRLGQSRWAGDSKTWRELWEESAS